MPIIEIADPDADLPKRFTITWCYEVTVRIGKLVRNKLTERFPGWRDFDTDIAATLARVFLSGLQLETIPIDEAFPEEEYLSSDEEDLVWSSNI